MNVNPDKIKELINNFADLYEEEQNKLIALSYKLLYEQSAKRDIQKQNISFNTKEEEQKEVEYRTNNQLKGALEVLDLINTMNDTKKAAFYMTLLNFQKQQSTLVDDSDITITINERKITTKQFLEKTLNNVDFSKAREISNRIHCEVVADMILKECNDE